MKTITYTLKKAGVNSTPFYRELNAFALQVNDFLNSCMDNFLKGYKNFITTKRIELLRSDAEYLYDFLAAGVYWNIYIERALELSNLKLSILLFLFNTRQKNKTLKPAIDYLRGILATLWMDDGHVIKFKAEPSLVNIFKLIRWLEATGEYREEVKRFYLVGSYLESLPGQEVNNFINIIRSSADWFEIESGKIFSGYTNNVESFLQSEYKNHRWKEDVIFCGRKPVEYHLAFTGAEMMNKSFRDDFNSSSGKTLLLPACMRSKNDKECKAQRTDFDLICAGCDAGCNVNQYRKLGKELGYKVHVIPHSNNFSNWLKRWAVGTNVGVIGVACPLNLITGGLELKALDIPAQCLFLDYCGCTNHWDKKGIPTNINKDQLTQILSN